MPENISRSLAPGKFITLEGIDGAGKSATIDTILSTVRSTGFKIIQTREPGGTPVGEKLREIVLDDEFTFATDAEILLIFASRAQHIEQKIRPNLQKGTWVLCDRFTDSTYAYQGGGRRATFKRVKAIDKWLQHRIKPDLTLFLNADVATGRTRLMQSELPADRFEQEPNEFHKLVQKAYLELARGNPGRIKTVDATLPVVEVREIVKAHITDFIQRLDD